jgi:hypothetical protein
VIADNRFVWHVNPLEQLESERRDPIRVKTKAVSAG